MNCLSCREIDLCIVVADREQVMKEPSRENLVWDPSIMNFVSEDDGMLGVLLF